MTIFFHTLSIKTIKSKYGEQQNMVIIQRNFLQIKPIQGRLVWTELK